MQRYDISQFDRDTYIVVDKRTKAEVCVCAAYEGGTDAWKRAYEVVSALNQTKRKGSFPSAISRERMRRKGMT
jgi:hypothetical protein